MTPTSSTPVAAIRQLAAKLRAEWVQYDSTDIAIAEELLAADLLDEFAALREATTPERVSQLCAELASGTNGNVPIQSVYESMLKLIGREDVIDDIARDWQTHEAAPPLREAQETATWQPMDSAPKDGREVVLIGHLSERGGPTSIRACVSRYRHSGADFPYIEGWPYFSPGYTDRFRPVAWMPLPSPPRAGEET